MFKKIILTTIISNFVILSQLLFSINITSAAEPKNAVTTIIDVNTSVAEPKNAVTTIIDVKKDFGAKGDGKNDDTQSIQKALNNASGKSVHFPAGSYLTTGNLKFSSNVTIYGDGYKSSKLISTTGNIFTVMSAKNVTISSLSFIGNNNSIADTISLLHLVNQSNLVIKDCYFKNAVRACLFLKTSTDVTIKNCTAVDGGYAGGLVFVTDNKLTVENCTATETVKCAGIVVTCACSNFILRNNTSTYNHGAGIAITGYSYNGKVTGNVCSFNGINTLDGYQDGINGHRLHDVVFENNTCNRNLKSGISVNGRDETTNTSCQNVTFRNNTCNNNKYQGIYLYFTQHCTVDNNTCLENEGTRATLGGIALKGASYNKITNNNVHDSGVVGGNICAEIRLMSDSGNNTVENNSIGCIVRTDQRNSIVIESTRNYLGAFDYSNYNWPTARNQKPITIYDRINQTYSAELLRILALPEFS